MRLLSKNLFFAITTLLFLALLFSFVVERQGATAELTLDALARKINALEVARITVRGNELEVKLKDGTEAVARKEPEAGLTETLANYGVSKEAFQAVSLEVRDESGSQFWLGVLVPTLLPLVIILAVFWFVFRQAKVGASQAFSFGKSNIRLFTAFKDKVTFKDVAGLKEAKQELEEVVDFLKNPKKFLDVGAKIPRGVLLMGPPGSGKTLLARATAGESGVPFFHISASEFVEMFVGVGAARTRDSFATAKKAAPAILFIDEIDAVGRERGAGLGGGHDEREQTLNQILVEMDGFDKETRVIVLAASVTGDTPVLVRMNNAYAIKPIAEVIDSFYANGEEGIEKPVQGAFQVLGYASRNGRPNHFGASAWSEVRGVFRHRVNEIYEIEYLGGTLRTTGNHSVFVRSHGGIHAKPVSEIAPGEILVDVPYLANHSSKQLRELRAHAFAANFKRELPVYGAVFERGEARVRPAYQYAMANTHGESQAAIAARFGLSQGTISHWQRNVSGPRALSRQYFKHVLPETVAVTPELCRLFGYYVAEGYARKEIDFCFNEREEAYLSDVRRLMEQNFHLVPDRERHITPHAVNLVYQAKPLAAFFSHYGGSGAHHKHVPPFLFEAPREYFIEFLRGVARGDGHIDARGRLEITSVSEQLITELNWLCRMHGLKSYVGSFTARAGRRIKEGKPLAATKAWRLGLGASQNPFNESRAGRRASIKRAIVKAVKKLPFDGYVYDFCGCENEAFFGGATPVLLHNTNRPDILDPALLRPGRFDRRVVLDLPDIKDREAILKIHAAGKPLEAEVNLQKVAVRTPGFSGADLANLVNEAAILTARENRKAIRQQDLYDSIEKVLLGPERRGLAISEREKKITAFHEAGHALVAASLKDADPVHKVSIVSRGRAGGYTLKLPLEEMRLKTKSQFLADLATLMGGYVAEEETFSDISTGASNDLKEASAISRRLVTKYGMSALGPITFGKSEELVFLGREIATEKDYSEEVAAKIDGEVKRFLTVAYEAAKKILRGRKAALEAIARHLIERETIEQEEFETLLKPFRLKPITIAA